MGGDSPPTNRGRDGRNPRCAPRPPERSSPALDGRPFRPERNDCVTTATTTDYAAITQRQSRTWSASDFARIGSTNLPPGELLCASFDVLPGERVLDVAAGHGNVSMEAARRRRRDLDVRRHVGARYGPTNVAFAALDEHAQEALAGDLLAVYGRHNRGGDAAMVAPIRIRRGDRDQGVTATPPTRSAAVTNNQTRTQMARQQTEHKGFGQPDEIREFANGGAENLKLGEGEVGRFVFEPAWCWSNDVEPIHLTESRPAGALDAADGSHERGCGMNRAERIGFWMYVAMGIVCVAVLVAAAISAIAS
jgi:hypothetical protein